MVVVATLVTLVLLHLLLLNCNRDHLRVPNRHQLLAVVVAAEWFSRSMATVIDQQLAKPSNINSSSSSRHSLVDWWKRRHWILTYRHHLSFIIDHQNPLDLYLRRLHPLLPLCRCRNLRLSTTCNKRCLPSWVRSVRLSSRSRLTLVYLPWLNNKRRLGLCSGSSSKWFNSPTTLHYSSNRRRWLRWAWQPWITTRTHRTAISAGCWRQRRPVALMRTTSHLLHSITAPHRLLVNRRYRRRLLWALPRMSVRGIIF